MLTADQEWESFLATNELKPEIKESIEENKFIPKVSPLYISTQTKICYLNQLINLENIFWQLPVIAYQLQQNGIVKKQIKTCNSHHFKGFELLWTAPFLKTFPWTSFYHFYAFGMVLVLFWLPWAAQGSTLRN